MSGLIKICGVTRESDAAHAARVGADLLGLNLWPGSKRCVEPARAAELAAAARAVRPAILVVGVLVDPSEAELAAAEAIGLDRIQLHGDEPAAVVARLGARVIKAIALDGEAALERLAACPAPTLLLDTPSAGRGGSGAVGDWALARRASDAARARGKVVLLAGGLTPANVAAAIRATRPSGVDVASGVESAPGIKDPARVEAFVRAVRAAGEQT